jgi:hypothetical protein
MFSVIFVDDDGEEKAEEKNIFQNRSKKYFTELQYINKLFAFFKKNFCLYVIFIFYTCSANLLRLI